MATAWRDTTHMTADEMRAELAHVAQEQKATRDALAVAAPSWLFPPGTIDAIRELLGKVAGTFVVEGPFIESGLPHTVVSDVFARSGSWWYNISVVEAIFADAVDSGQAAQPLDMEEPIAFEPQTITVEWRVDLGSGDAQDAVPAAGLFYAGRLYATINELIASNRAPRGIFADALVNVAWREREQAHKNREADLDRREEELLAALASVTSTLDLVIVAPNRSRRLSHIDSRAVPRPLIEREGATIVEFLQHLGIRDPEHAFVFYGDMQVMAPRTTSIKEMLRRLQCEPRNPPRLLIIDVSDSLPEDNEVARPHAKRHREGDNVRDKEELPSTQVVPSLLIPKKEEEEDDDAADEEFPLSPLPFAAMGCRGASDFVIADAEYAAAELRVNTDTVPVLRLLAGMRVEQEHGFKFGDDRFNVTRGDSVMTARIALAHFSENPGDRTLSIPDYYMLLAQSEMNADEMWEKSGVTKPRVFL